MTTLLLSSNLSSLIHYFEISRICFQKYLHVLKFFLNYIKPGFRLLMGVASGWGIFKTLFLFLPWTASWSGWNLGASTVWGTLRGHHFRTAIKYILNWTKYNVTKTLVNDTIHNLNLAVNNNKNISLKINILSYSKLSCWFFLTVL